MTSGTTHRHPRRPLFTAVPAWALVPALLTLGLALAPVLALIVRAPWGNLTQVLTSPQLLTATGLTLGTSLTTTALAALLGTPTALVLATVLERTRHRFLVGTLYSLIYAPIIFSPVVSGLALLFFWGRRGVLGAHLENLGLSIAYTPLAVVLAQLFVALPFFIATTVTSLRALPVECEEIARLEGANATQVSTRVLLPLAAPGLATAALLAFARALGEYGATITFAGNVEGATRTIPLSIELALGSNQMDQALGAALMLIAIYLALLAWAVLIRWIFTLKGGRL